MVVASHGLTSLSYMSVIGIRTISITLTTGKQSFSPPTLTGAGPPTNGEYQQGLQPMALTG